MRRKIKRHFERLGSGRQFDRRTHVRTDPFFRGGRDLKETTFSDPQRRSRQVLFKVGGMVENNYEKEVDIRDTIANCDIKR